MKKLILITILYALLFNKIVYSQNFFPLNVGNAFQYNGSLYYDGPGGGGVTTITWENFFVLADTVIGDEVYYRTSPFFFSNPSLLRYDIENQILWIRLPSDSIDHIAVDFNATSNFTSYITGSPIIFNTDGIQIDTVLGRIVKVFSMSYFYSSGTYIIRKEFTFAENLGLIYYHSSGGDIFVFSSRTTNLIAYKIGNNYYNNAFNVSINKIFPIINRPKNAFPFVLTIDYSIQVNALKESLYIELWHIRNGIVKRYFKFEITSGNSVNVPILPDWLEVDDLIKIRAKISEKSIFRNTDYFPEKGFAYMKVLPPITDVYENKLDLTFSLEQNYPNPFNPSTKISWQSPVSSWQTLKVYDILGNEVATLVDEYREAGKYEVEFDAENLSSGIYLYKLQAGSFIDTKKMILMR
ncbi:MAG: hypothetical protein KatS3mg036_0886 [Ignavibacterium sp.]|nr:MAG: hypothetical protein KatS3mg036_0886 [Ignavibacterium sp.]